MASNPLVPQGTINRLLASIIWNDYPSLNITASFLAPEAIDLTLEGSATLPLPTMTGIVTSPEPYQLARFQAHLIRSQFLPSAYKLQMETSTLLGDCTIRPDTATLPPYQISNCSIMGVDRMAFAGRDAGWVISFTGAYYINSSLWI